MKLRTIKVEDADWEAWKAKSVNDGVSLSEWIRQRCNEESGKSRKKAGTDVPRVEGDKPVERSVGGMGLPAYLDHPKSCKCGPCEFAREVGLK